ncbi:MAG: NAD(+)/NADH kinase [Phycisphaerales bacterium]|nr:NAD(+)/NADH kinase [Phycisphaerales bacterium]
MSTPSNRPRLLILADDSREDVASVLGELRTDFEKWGESVTYASSAEKEPLPENLEADLAVVIGGDGAMISQSGRLVGCGMPLIGINCGRLGFLAAFDAASLRTHADILMTSTPPVRHHMLMEVTRHHEGETDHAVAVNDAVVTAGPPYRMVELSLSIGGVQGPQVRGDGLIVASPTGSTAHNLSAGGPIIGPGVDALVVSPLAPQSLAFRPIVLDAGEGVEVEVERSNDGTTLVLDGQTLTPLASGDRLVIRRHERTIPMVVNPDEPFWRILQERMRWAAPPVFR